MVKAAKGSDSAEQGLEELAGLRPEELVRLLREAIAENLGDEIAAKSTLHYSGGWFYFNQARRYGDRSVGTVGPSDGLRRRGIAELIIRHRRHAAEKLEQSKRMRSNYGACEGCKTVGKIFPTKKGWHCVHCLWLGGQE